MLIQVHPKKPGTCSHTVLAAPGTHPVDALRMSGWSSSYTNAQPVDGAHFCAGHPQAGHLLLTHSLKANGMFS
jgi:hypothetical protein